jgi:hypothetical protein
MNIFGLFGLASFLRSMRPKNSRPYQPQGTTLPWIKQEFNDLSDELDYYINKFNNYKNKSK